MKALVHYHTFHMHGDLDEKLQCCIWKTIQLVPLTIKKSVKLQRANLKLVQLSIILIPHARCLTRSEVH